MVAAAQNFVTLFSPFDQIGLITFDLTPKWWMPPTAPISRVTANIGHITCGSNTNTITALDMAYQQIKAINKPLALNTIVLFHPWIAQRSDSEFPDAYGTRFSLRSGHERA